MSEDEELFLNEIFAKCEVRFPESFLVLQPQALLINIQAVNLEGKASKRAQWWCSKQTAKTLRIL